MNESKPKSVECLETGPIWPTIPKKNEFLEKDRQYSEEEFKRLYLGTWENDHHNSGRNKPETDPQSNTRG